MPFDEHQTARLAQVYPSVDPALLLDVLGAFGFSAAGYLQLNPDLVAAGLNGPAATCHYLACGAPTEQRRFQGAADGGDWIAALDRLPLATGPLRQLAINLLHNRMLDGQPLLADPDALAALLAVCRGKDMRPLLVVGDSHSHPYARLREVDGVVCVPLHLLCSGGSAGGLANPDSKSGYGRRVVRFFEDHAGLVRGFDLPCFFKFGQVDAEFVWIFKRARRNQVQWSMQGFEAFAAASVDRYATFLQRLVDGHGIADHVRVLSVFPPTLSDAAWHAGYVNAHIGFLESDLALDALAAKVRRLAIPSQRERTRQHLLWNALVMRECARRGLAYVDDFQTLVGGRGVVDANWVRGHDGSDHHLPVAALDSVVAEIFRRFATVGGDSG